MLKDITGLTREDLEIDPGSRLESVFDHYAGLFPRLRELSGSVVIAQNRQFASREMPVSEGDEIALLPPVSGGTSRYTHEVLDPAGHFFALTRQPIDECAIRRQLLQGLDGAVVTFDGVVRNNTK